MHSIVVDGRNVKENQNESRNRYIEIVGESRNELSNLVVKI